MTLVSVYLCVPILFQFIDPRPRTPSGPFIGILLPTQGPVQACSSRGLCVTDSRPSWACSSMGLCVTDSRPFGVSGRGPFSSPTKCWSREGREKGFGLCLGLHCGSLLGLGTRPYHLSLKPVDISYDVFGLFIATKTSLEAVFLELGLSSYK